MTIMEDIRNYICSGVGIKRNVNENDDEDSSSRLDPEEITKEDKNISIDLGEKKILKHPQTWSIDSHISTGIDIVYRKRLKNQGFQEHIYNCDRSGKAKRSFSLTTPYLQHFHVGNNHWALFHMEPKLHCCTFFDSMDTGLTEDTKVEYYSKLEILYSNMQVMEKHWAKVQQQ